MTDNATIQQIIVTLHDGTQIASEQQAVPVPAPKEAFDGFKELIGDYKQGQSGQLSFNTKRGWAIMPLSAIACVELVGIKKPETDV
jgi:hypothetical protein